MGNKTDMKERFTSDKDNLRLDVFLAEKTDKTRSAVAKAIGGKGVVKWESSVKNRRKDLFGRRR